MPYILAAVVLGIGTMLAVGNSHARTALALAPIGLVIAANLFVVRALRLAPRPLAATRWRRIGRDIIEWVPDCIRQVPVRLRHEPRLLPAAIGYWPHIASRQWCSTRSPSWAGFSSWMFLSSLSAMSLPIATGVFVIVSSEGAAAGTVSLWDHEWKGDDR